MKGKEEIAQIATISAADAETVAVAAQTVDLLSFAGDLPGSPSMTMTGTSRYSEVTAKYFHFARRGPTTSAGGVSLGVGISCGSDHDRQDEEGRVGGFPGRSANRGVERRRADAGWSCAHRLQRGLLFVIGQEG